MASTTDPVQCPIITCIQKIVVYETKARFYIVGSNNTETAFRVLKIDRTEPKELHINDDHVEYSPREIRDLLMMIDVGNRPKQQTKGTTGLIRTVSAFGLVGFVQFLEGYYMILITKRRKVAQVGPHTLYKIEDTCMVYVPNDSVKYTHPDEQKYVKLFQSMDLSSNFYFSYSYDLSRTLQYHLTPCRDLDPKILKSTSRKHIKIHIPKTSDEDLNHSSGGRTSVSSESSAFDPVAASSPLRSSQITAEVLDKVSSASHAEHDDTGDLFSEEVEQNQRIRNHSGGGSESKKTTSTPSRKKDFKGGLGKREEGENMVNHTTIDGGLKPGAADLRNNISNMMSGRKMGLGIKTEPTWRYVWNLYLLHEVRDTLHPDWLLYITHGFIGQSSIQVFGKSLYLTLIARRSNQFAGTRFLKRGSNAEGYVANEVETEQIVHDSSISDLRKAHISSFVQLRGSLPLCWSQDISKMMPKPTINIDQADPYGYVAGQHFNRVFSRYGAPVILLNLVKKREKKRHESILTYELLHVIRYLNQFLPQQHHIKYIGFDMARVSKNSKNKEYNVLERLATIAEYCVKKTGIFITGPGLHCNVIRPHPKAEGMEGLKFELGTKQRGVTRTNCIDCLDRTNTAQFAIGKCALAFQLYSLGIIHKPSLQFETDCVRMLEELYEDHGDTLALQYGGSQLVHRIKGYRNVAHWTSSSKDIMQTMSRYLSNTFSDTDKQHSMNLFLGVFSPQNGRPNVWDLPTDFYLHHPIADRGPRPRTKCYSQWWDVDVFRSLPYSSEEKNKGKSGDLIVLKTSRFDERINEFWDYYRPYEMTCLNDHYTLHMPNSVRDFKPKFANNYSPFALRIQPGRRMEEYGTKSAEINPNICGQDSTASVMSTGSESTDSSDESDILEGDLELGGSGQTTPDRDTGYVTFKDLFATMSQTYGVELKDPDPKNITMYRRYAQIGHNATRPMEHTPSIPSRYSTELIQKSVFPLDSSYSVEPPMVSPRSRDIYDTYVKRGKVGAAEPTMWDRTIYQQYLRTKYL